MNDQDRADVTTLRVGASDVSHADDLGCEMVTIAEHADGDGWHIIISLADHFDEQDVAQGMDTYAISTDSGATAYGGIVSVSADDREVTVDLDGETAETLGLGSSVKLEFADRGDASEVSGALGRMREASS